MAVGDAGLETRRVAGPEHSLALVLAQHQGALENKDELILGRVPVALGGLCARLQSGEVDAELIETDHVAEPLAQTAGNRGAIRLRIAGGRFHFHLRKVDLRHSRLSFPMCGQTRSMMVAVPMPAPMHRVTSAVLRLRRSSSSSAM